MLSELWSDIRYRARALFRRAEVERELDQEMEFHLQREAERHARAGLSPQEARWKAQAEFGGVDQMKEESRDGWGLALIDGAMQDLRYAIRSLRRSPGFTGAVVLTLGLGIGANVAMFGVVDRLLFRPPPFLHDAGRVNRVYLTYSYRGKDYTNSSIEYTRYLDLARWTHSFSSVAAFDQRTMAVGSGTDAREVGVQSVSASYFGLFDVTPELGRFFQSSEDTVPVGAAVAVISDAYWRTSLGARPDVLGLPLQVGSASYTIIGVAPRGFVGVPGDEAPAVFIPITTFAAGAGIGAADDWFTRYHWSWMQMLARRKPGVTVSQASADLTEAYLRSWNTELALEPGGQPAAVGRPRGLAAPVLEERGPNQTTVAKVAAWTSGVAFIVLLIACANVANLLLARALRRRREIALRLALGVSRRRLITQLLTETLLLGGIGAVAGLLLSQWVGAVVRTLFLPPGAASASLLDPRTLAFAAGAAIVAGGLTGLAPIFQARHPDLVGALKAGAREGTYRHSRTRTLLLLTQGALSLVLLVGAGLFVKSLRRVEALRLGYDVDPLLYVDTRYRGTRLSADQRTALMLRLQQAAQALPGIEVASRAVTVPFSTEEMQGLFVPGIDSVDRLGRFTLQMASAEYFQAMGTRIVRGRGIATADRAGTPGVILVSESMAHALWPNQDPLGKCIKVGADTAPCSTVIGVTEDIRQSSLSEKEGGQYYLALDQMTGQNQGLYIRARGDAASQRDVVRRALQPLMPGAAYVTVTPMREIIDPNLKSWRLGATMFLVFGGLALVLAAIGLYSVIAYDVAQRTHELGVRIALGARLADVLRLVVGDGVRFAVIGVGAGGVIALLAGRWIEPLLFEVSANDPVIYGTVAAVLLAVAALASMVPALRAAKVNPSTALRGE
ncbi:MAG TPA: ADOP family duplicated permease [Gemmatimonadales bacterium]|nr:ADOP family duplicated permease [Gemmatimonadales bacterium]